MKLKAAREELSLEAVTPFVGVWIEIGTFGKLLAGESVTPFVGVWIEIQKHEIGTQAKDVTPFMK